MSKFSEIGKGRAPAPSTTSLDISDFEPGSPVPRNPVADQQVADRVASRRGLTESPVQRVPLKRTALVKDRLMIEGPLSTLNRFRELCNDLGGRPYHEALAFLLDRHDETR